MPPLPSKAPRRSITRSMPDFKLPESYLKQLQDANNDLQKANGYEKFKFLSKANDKKAPDSVLN